MLIDTRLGSVGDWANDLLRVGGAISVLTITLWTIFRSFTRERAYALLRTDIGLQRKFIEDVLKDKSERLVICALVLDAMQDENLAPRHRTVIEDLFPEEIDGNKRARSEIARVGEIAGDAIRRNEVLEEIFDKLSLAQTSNAEATAVMAETMRNMAGRVDDLKKDIHVLSDHVRETNRIIIQHNTTRRA